MISSFESLKTSKCHFISIQVFQGTNKFWQIFCEFILMGWQEINEIGENGQKPKFRCTVVEKNNGTAAKIPFPSSSMLKKMLMSKKRSSYNQTYYK